MRIWRFCQFFQPDLSNKYVVTFWRLCVYVYISLPYHVYYPENSPIHLKNIVAFAAKLLCVFDHFVDTRPYRVKRIEITYYHCFSMFQEIATDFEICSMCGVKSLWLQLPQSSLFTITDRFSCIKLAFRKGLFWQLSAHFQYVIINLNIYL